MRTTRLGLALLSLLSLVLCSGCRAVAGYAESSGDGGIALDVVGPVDAGRPSETPSLPADGWPTPDIGVGDGGAAGAWVERWGSSNQPSELAGLGWSPQAGVLQIAGTSHEPLDIGGLKTVTSEGVFVATLDGDGLAQRADLVAQGKASAAAIAVHRPTGDLFVAGTFKGTAQGGATWISAGNNDALVVAYDRQGQYRWARALGAQGDIAIGGLATDGVNVYVVGSYKGAFTACSAGQGEGGFIAALDSGTGTVRACQVAAGTGSVRIESVAAGAAGLFIAVTYEGVMIYGADHAPLAAGVRRAALYWVDGQQQLSPLGSHYLDAGSTVTTEAVRLALGAAGLYVAEQRQDATTKIASIAISLRAANTLPATLWQPAQQVIEGLAGGSVVLTSLVAGQKVVVAGYSDGVLTLSGKLSTTYESKEDGFIAVLDQQGSPIALQGVGGAETDRITALELANDVLFVGGQSDGPLTLGGTPTARVGTRDIFVAALSLSQL